MKNQSKLAYRRRSVEPALRPSVLGLDPSLSSTGYAYWHNSRLVTGRIESGKLRGSHRLYYMRLQLSKVLDVATPSLVSFEGYAMGARGNNMFNIGELGGVFKTLIWERCVDLLEIPPTVLKSAIALNGRAEKSQVATALKVRYGIDVPQHDEADAAALLLLGEMRAGVRRAPTPVGKSDRFDAVRSIQIVKGRLNLIANLK